MRNPFGGGESEGKMMKTQQAPGLQIEALSPQQQKTAREGRERGERERVTSPPPLSRPALPPSLSPLDPSPPLLSSFPAPFSGDILHFLVESGRNPLSTHSHIFGFRLVKLRNGERKTRGDRYPNPPLPSLGKG